MRDDSPIFLIGNPGSDPEPIELGEILEHYVRIRDAIASTTIEVASDSLSIVGYNSFIYAFNVYKALGLLLPELYFESGYALLRQLWEVTLNLAWIAAMPEQRASDFLEFTLVEFKKNLAREGVKESLHEFDKSTRPIQSRYEFSDRKGKVRTHSSFAMSTVKERASELGEPWFSEYDTVYTLGSAHTHASPGVVSLGTFTANYSKPDIRERNYTAIVALRAIRVIIRLLETLDEIGMVKEKSQLSRVLLDFNSCSFKKNK